MARLIYARHALLDLERLADFIADAGGSGDAIELVIEAIEMLERHPLIGRPVEDGLRELVISRGRSGYVALYDYLRGDDLVVVLAIRHQREAGYGSD